MAGRRGREAGGERPVDQRLELGLGRPVAGLDQDIGDDAPCGRRVGGRAQIPSAGGRSGGVVGLDDARDQRMADDIGGGEAHLRDAGDVP